MENMRIPFENEFIKYIEDEYFGGDRDKLVEHTGYSKRQITKWANGVHKPQKATMRYILSSVLAPEFKIVCEYHRIAITSEQDIPKCLKESLGNHHDRPGIYAFYDSSCNLLYIGKTSAKKGLFGEIYQQLRGPIGMNFPKAIKSPPKARWEVAAFISAYEVPLVEHIDYPKHVESLILRLSKPVGNKQLGNLNTLTRPPEEK